MYGIHIRFFFHFAQITPETVIGSEVPNPGNDDQYNAGIQLHKRYLGSLAKNKQLPTVQQRSYFVPPLVSTYGKEQQQSSYTDEYNAKGKRYLGALARSGDLNLSKSQEKRSADEFGSDIEEIRLPNRDDLQNPMIMKEEMITYLRPIILEYLNKYNKKHDPRKVELFLENLADAVFDQNEEIRLENIEALVQSDYFQPEGSVVEQKQNNSDKRSIQSLVRERNVSYSGTAHVEPQPQQPPVRQPAEYYNERIRPNLEAVIKSRMAKRHLGSVVASGYATRVPPKRDSVDALLSYLNDADQAAYPYNDNSEYLSRIAKRHTMYDINEPDITFEYPSQVGEQVDYNDYAEQDAPIAIGKRYLGKHYDIVEYSLEKDFWTRD